jgi:hypothetical protein
MGHGKAQISGICSSATGPTRRHKVVGAQVPRRSGDTIRASRTMVSPHLHGSSALVLAPLVAVADVPLAVFAAHHPAHQVAHLVSRVLASPYQAWR